MAKLIDRSAASLHKIGRDGLLSLIDEVNTMRARSGQRRRFRPNLRKTDGVLEMQEFEEFPRPARADTPSPRYSDGPRLVHVR